MLLCDIASRSRRSPRRHAISPDGDDMRPVVYAFMTLVLGIVIPAQTAFADNRVLVIGIDGAGGSFLNTANTPAIDALIAGGAVRYDFLNEGALVPNPPSGYGASGVNWSTIATGASAAHHGVIDNSFAGSKFNLYPHFFKHIKDHDASRYTASIVNWEPINTQILANQYANLEQNYPSDVSVRSATVNLLNTGDPDAIFLHFDQVDGAGHSSGWGSAPYYAAITSVDTLIGNIMTALNARPGVVAGTENWLVIVTADHGGQGTGHNAGQGLINWEVPFVVSGNSVPDGAVRTGHAARCRADGVVAPRNRSLRTWARRHSAWPGRRSAKRNLRRPQPGRRRGRRRYGPSSHR